MKKYVFRLKENPPNSSHHSSCFIWCGKAAEVKRKWKGGESKPSCDCFNSPNVSLMKTLLFSTMIFWRERGTGKPLFTVERFALYLPGCPTGVSPCPLGHSASLLGGSWGFPQTISFICWFSEVFTWPHWSPGSVGWFFTSRASHWGAKCQHKWFSKCLMNLKHCPLSWGVILWDALDRLSPGTHFEKQEISRNANYFFFANCSRTEIKLAKYLWWVIPLQYHSAEEKALLKLMCSLDFIVQRIYFTMQFS